MMEMNRKPLIALVMGLMMLTMLPSTIILADEYWGWEEIRPALIDGDGAEFVKPIPGFSPNEFTGATEMEAVQVAANWVAYHMFYESDTFPSGDVWTSSDQQFGEITIGVEGSGTGDCEDFSILLCAILRFHTQGGIPAKRVWVQGGILVAPEEEDKPPIFGHAFIVYKTEKGGIYYIEPQWGGIPYRGSPPSVLHWYFKRPLYAGYSAMLRFNDQWVKGGGFWLAGRR